MSTLIAETPAQIQLFSLLVAKSALKLNAKGMQSRHDARTRAFVRRVTGSKAKTSAELLIALEAFIAASYEPKKQPVIIAPDRDDTFIEGEFQVERFESTTQKGLWFFVERSEPATFGGPECFIVMAQADGAPKTEAYDDWFINMGDALEIARQLAEGSL